MGCCGGNKVDAEGHSKYDPDFKGPVPWSERTTRDIIWVLAYAALWVGLVSSHEQHATPTYSTTNRGTRRRTQAG